MMNSTVPAPWTPVEVSEDEKGIRVSVLGRCYDFKKELFPVSIKSNGTEILSSPMVLRGEEDGREIMWKNTETWVQEVTDSSVVICGGMETDLFIISSVVTVDYDGYINFSFKLSPMGANVREGFDVSFDRQLRIIDSLHLEVPMVKEIAILNHKSATDTGRYNGAAQEEFSYLKPVNWFGCEKAGLGIYIESTENWQPKDRRRSMETFVDGESYVIRFHILDSMPMAWNYEYLMKYSDSEFANTKDAGKFTLPPLSYSLSIQATPVKPFDNSFLKEHIIHIDCFERIECEYTKYFLETKAKNTDMCILDYLKSKGVTVISLHQKWNRIQGYWNLGPNDSKRIKQLIDEIHKRDMKVIFYFCNTISTLRPVTDKYIQENRQLNADGRPVTSFYRTPPQRSIRTCANGPDLFNDFTKGMAEFVREYNADGVYIDTANVPWHCTNESHGCGYRDLFGVLHATYPVEGMRRAFRHIYEEIHHKLGKEVHIHPHDSFMPSVYAYGDLFWGGEYIALKHKTDSEAIINEFKPELIRTILTGKNVGVPGQLLVYELPNKTWDFQKAMSIIAPYGVYMRPVEIYSSLDYMRGIWQALDKFKVWECELNPFYQGNTGAECDNENVMISSYESDDEFVLVATNPGEKSLKNVKISCRYPLDTELISGYTYSSQNEGVDFEPYDTKFIRCKKQ